MIPYACERSTGACTPADALARRICIAIAACVPVLAAAAVEPAQPVTIQQDDLLIRLAPRTPDQIASFYIARGFPETMVRILKQQCFITTRIHNQRASKLWHDLANWTFTHEGKTLHRRHRTEWLKQWRDMDMPLSSISTFRWTLLPETLDYLPNEEEGGNIILPRVDGPITVEATFRTGDDGSGPVIRVRYEPLYCAESAAP